MHPEMVAQQLFVDFVRPLDDDDPVVPDVVEAERGQVDGVQAVKVEVGQPEPPLEEGHEDEGRAGDVLGGEAPARPQPLWEIGLSPPPVRRPRRPSAPPYPVPAPLPPTRTPLRPRPHNNQ